MPNHQAGLHFTAFHSPEWSQFQLAKRITYEVKQQMIGLSGACFWFWNSFYTFLESCGVSRSMHQRFPKETYNKYDVMRNVLALLEEQGNEEVINSLVSNFYRMKNAVDKDNVDAKKAKTLLAEFRDAVGNDPIEVEIQKRQSQQAREKYKQALDSTNARHSYLTELNKRFQDLAVLATLTEQQRGFKLETLFFDLLHFSEIENTKPYRTPSNEQIDGHFKFEKFDYLVELHFRASDYLMKRVL